jgi:hypothetical protein
MIYADHVLEHLDNPIAVLTELHRIAQPDCIVQIWVPHFRSYWAALDPTHKHVFTLASMDYVTAGREFHIIYGYTDIAYDLIAVKLNERWPSPGVRGIARWISGKWPFFYDYRLSHLVPLDEISFRLRAIKDVVPRSGDLPTSNAPLGY